MTAQYTITYRNKVGPQFAVIDAETEGAAKRQILKQSPEATILSVRENDPPLQTIIGITEQDVVKLAERLLLQLHAHLDTNGTTVSCSDCGAAWRAGQTDGKDPELKLDEVAAGSGACEAEVLRILTSKSLFSELGRRRGKSRKTITRAGGRPRTGAKRCECGKLTARLAKIRRHVCDGPAEHAAGDDGQTTKEKS